MCNAFHIPRYDLLTENDMKQFMKTVIAITVYVLCIFYSIQKLDITKVALLLPLILITTLPPLLRYGFDIHYAPVSDPLLIFMLLIITGTLWYTFTTVDECVSDDLTKAFNINTCIIFVFFYVLFKHFYNNTRMESLSQAFMLTGACGVFMASAPMYAYSPTVT